MSPSHYGSVCLLLWLGVVSAFGNPIQSLHSVNEKLGLKEMEIGSEPLFNSVIKSINGTCQKMEDVQLINATLDVYMRIFSSILHHQGHAPQQQRGHAPSLLEPLSAHDRRQVTAWVRDRQERMKELRSSMEERRNHRSQDLLSQLNRIKVDDLINQRKALVEFELVFGAASLMASPTCELM